MMATGERAGTAAIPPSDWRKACSGCGAIYGASEWQALPLSSTLPSEAVQAHLSVPVLWQVERRSCRCGSVLSGLVRAA